MQDQNFTTSLTACRTPEDVFDAINNVRGFVPGTKVVWRVLENYFSFTEDRSESKGTEISFEIARKGRPNPKEKQRAVAAG